METKEKEIEMKEEKEEKNESEQKEDGSEKASETKSKISMKTAVIIGIIIILGAFAFYSKGLFIAATVDGAPISRISVIRQLESESGKKALEDMIIKQLLNEEARKKGIIKITPEDINAEIQKIEEQVKAQGGTLDAVLSAQGMTRESMSEQIMLQKKIEKLLEDKVQVTDEEAAKLITDSKATVPKGEEEKFKTQAKEQIRVQKMNNELAAYIDSLKAQAKIRYFVNY